MTRRTLRETIKRFAPAPLRRMVEDVRGATAQPPIDDVVLADWQFEPDPAATPRLTLLLPNVTEASFFGGHATGIDLFLEIGKRLSDKIDIDLRILITDPTAQTDPGLLIRRIRGGSMPGIELVEGGRAVVTARRHDVFIAFNWWTAHNARALASSRDRHFGRDPSPQLYLIQEYEPQIFPLGSAHLLAREAYDRAERLWGIFNSSLLHEWFANCGHDTERAFVFEPVMDFRMRILLGKAKTSARRQRILVYGRPNIPRNCWPALVRGLRRFAQDYPQFADWEVVSVGGDHPPVALGGGRFMRSLGKLSIEDYAKTMLESSVGVSLMASPHPSYPPLEMAHFGLCTVTNRYWRKDLAQVHDNILSTPSIDASPLAATIAEACEAGANPDARPLANYVREAPFEIADDIADALIAEFSR